MNRKLHNTTMAMIASSSLFVLGLLTATPADPTTAAVAASIDASLDVAAEEEIVLADVLDEGAEQSEAAPRRHVRRGRQASVAMPFFSFAPRG